MLAQAPRGPPPVFVCASSPEPGLTCVRTGPVRPSNPWIRSSSRTETGLPPQGGARSHLVVCGLWSPEPAAGSPGTAGRSPGKELPCRHSGGGAGAQGRGGPAHGEARAWGHGRGGERAHGGLATYHLIFKNQSQGAKEVLFPFLKDDKCTDINIFLVPMATIFKRGWSWLFSSPRSSIYPGHFTPPLCLGAGVAALTPPFMPPEGFHLTLCSSPAAEGALLPVPLRPGQRVTSVALPPPPPTLHPPTSFEGRPRCHRELPGLPIVDLLRNNSPLGRPRFIHCGCGAEPDGMVWLPHAQCLQC